MTGKIIYQIENRYIYEINGEIHKIGGHNPFEAEIMIYIKNNTNIPIPNVLDYGVDENGKNFIKMEKIEGDTLEKIWEKLDNNRKKEILLQLKKYIYEMRKLKFKYIGIPVEKPCYEFLISENPAGPFYNLEDLYKYRIKKLTIDEKDFESYIKKPKDYHIYNFVFSHNDIGPYNIMVKDGKITGILDWELSGSYPSYWEYNRTVYHRAYTEEWKEILKNILDNTKPKDDISNLEKFIYYLEIYSNKYVDENTKNDFKKLAKQIIK